MHCTGTHARTYHAQFRQRTQHQHPDKTYDTDMGASFFRVNRWAHSISLAFPGGPFFIAKHATDGSYSGAMIQGLPRDTHLPHRALARGWRIYDFPSKNCRGINQSRISTMVAASERAACNADTLRWRRELRFYPILSFVNPSRSPVHSHTRSSSYMYNLFHNIIFFHTIIGIFSNGYQFKNVFLLVHNLLDVVYCKLFSEVDCIKYT